MVPGKENVTHRRRSKNFCVEKFPAKGIHDIVELFEALPLLYVFFLGGGNAIVYYVCSEYEST